MATNPTSSPGSPQSREQEAGAAEAVRDTATRLGSDVKEEALHEAGKAQRKTSESMRAFADAIRNAGEDLANKDQGPAAQLLGRAAESLEQLSNAVGRKSLEEIVGDVRSFGHRHPGAFMMGSVLVGMALGRFAQSAMPRHAPSSQSDAFASRPRAGLRRSHTQSTTGGSNELE